MKSPVSFGAGLPVCIVLYGRAPVECDHYTTRGRRFKGQATETAAGIPKCHGERMKCHTEHHVVELT